MEIHPADIIISLVNIIVLFFLLRMILWKYITKYLSERKARIQKEMDDAAEVRREAEEYRDEFKQKIATIEEQGQAIIRDRTQQASEEAASIIEEARQTVEKMLKDAEFRIEIEKAQALKDTQANIAQLATEMAARILDREVSSADNARTVNEFFDDL